MNNSDGKNNTKKAWVAWSFGKDSAFTLHWLLKEKIFSVVSLLTTVTTDHERVSMHSTRKTLLQLQANILNLPLEIVEIPKHCPDQCYVRQMSVAMMQAESLNIQHIAFGDLFLESVRQYREKQLQKTKIKSIFPLLMINYTNYMSLCYIYG